eukprot:PLAT3082.1.p3 GENE.PLAT3082.1~~PLAT3082.1.p3  ORF type:complete len:297 (+),score=109.09 PLAT3082.1:12-902(+)
MAEAMPLEESLPLYERAVNRKPGPCISFVEKAYATADASTPLRRLREDFAGSSVYAAEFVRRDIRRSALAVDLDGGTLGWADKHTRAKIGDAGSRLRLHCGNVLDDVPLAGPSTGSDDEGDDRPWKADVVLAVNYAFNFLHSRKLLLEYLRLTVARLAPGGCLVADEFGGTQAGAKLHAECSLGDGDVYHWLQKPQQLLTGHMYTKMMFSKLADEHDAGDEGSGGGESALRLAFSYSWRLWTIAELREAILESGFVKVDVWWSATAEDGISSEYRQCEAFPQSDNWNVFLVCHAPL